MRLRSGTLLCFSLLLFGCGGSGGSDASINLDRYGDGVQRESRTPQIEGMGHQPTLDFFHFTDQKAVLVARFPNESREFSMDASLVLFGSKATSDAIRRWINSESSGTNDPRAATPNDEIELEQGEHFLLGTSVFQDSLAQSSGAQYERYQLEYEFLSAELPGKVSLQPFTAFTTVYVWVNDYSDIVNEPLPMVERFDASSEQVFFSPDHEPLNTRYARFAPSLDDPLPAFYFPLCCFDQVLDDGRPQIDSTRLSVKDGAMRIDKAQFTVGQVQHLYRSLDNPHPKVDSTLYHYIDTSLTSWGELDLSEPYRISFCVEEASSEGTLTLWVDNNGGADILSGPFNHTSRLTQFSLDLLIPGKRVTLDVPGDVRIGQDPPVSEIPSRLGTKHSFLQLRVTDGTLTLGDFVIERQDGEQATGLTCG